MADEKLGIESLEPIIDAVGEAINVGYKLGHGGGYLSALAFIDEATALGRIQKGTVVPQFKDLSKDERARLHARLKGKISLEDKALEARIEQGDDCLEELVELGYEQYDLVQKGVALYNKIQSLFKKQQ